MIVYEPGHIYKLDALDGPASEILTFVNRGSNPHSGTNCQEVIRALIDRVQFLEAELHWPLNEEILGHLRLALALFEARAIIRKTQLRKIDIEVMATSGDDGHLLLTHKDQAT